MGIIRLRMSRLGRCLAQDSGERKLRMAYEDREVGIARQQKLDGDDCGVSESLLQIEQAILSGHNFRSSSADPGPMVRV